MRTILLLLPLVVFHLVVQPARAGFEQRPAGARFRAMGGASAGLCDDAWSLLVNPAGMASGGMQPSWELAVSSSPRPFGLPELSDIAVAVLARSSAVRGTLGVAAHRFGFSLYREMSGTVGYAAALDRLSLGVAVNFYWLSVARYGSAAAAGLDIGIRLRILEGLQWGIAAHNLNAPSIGSAHEKLPGDYRVGIACFPAPRTCLAADLVKQNSFPVSPRIGVELWPLAERLGLRAGFSGGGEVAAGFGLAARGFRLDYAGSHHQELGWTHTVSFALTLGEHGKGEEGQ